MSVESLLNQTATIQRKTVTYSESGSPSASWEDAATDVPCAIESRGRGLFRLQGGWSVKSRYRVFLPSGTDIQREDMLLIGSESYLVVDVFDSAGRGVLLEAELTKPE